MKRSGHRETVGQQLRGVGQQFAVDVAVCGVNAVVSANSDAVAFVQVVAFVISGVSSACAVFSAVTPPVEGAADHIVSVTMALSSTFSGTLLPQRLRKL